jgi:O-antigen biosynthesis protein
MIDVTQSSLPPTGERFLPAMGGDIEVEHVHRYLAASRCVDGLDVLDIASGEGYGANLLAGKARSVIGIDISAEAVEHAKHTYVAENLSYCTGSCSSIPLGDSCVDAVISFETIEHHAEHEAMLREIKRVLKPNGFCVISSPNKFEYSDIPNYSNPYHVAELYREEFEALLRRAFSNVLMYGQSLVRGSLLEPLFDAANASRLNSFAPQRGQRKRSSIPARSVYFIAVASNADLPEFSSGFYETSTTAEIAEASAVSNQRHTFVQVYWGVESSNGVFSEQASTSVEVGLDAALREIAIELPFVFGDTQLVSLRLDPSSTPAVATLRYLSIEGSDGETIWEIKANSPEVSASPSALVSGEEVWRITCLTEDPQIHIRIPAFVKELSGQRPLLMRIMGHWQAFAPEAVFDIANSILLPETLNRIGQEIEGVRTVVLSVQQTEAERWQLAQVTNGAATQHSVLQSQIDGLHAENKSLTERLYAESQRVSATQADYTRTALAQERSELVVMSLNADLVELRRLHTERLASAAENIKRREDELRLLSASHAKVCGELTETAKQFRDLDSVLKHAQTYHGEAATKHAQLITELSCALRILADEFQTWRSTVHEREALAKTEKAELELTLVRRDQMIASIRALRGYSWLKAFNWTTFPLYAQKTTNEDPPP